MSASYSNQVEQFLERTYHEFHTHELRRQSDRRRGTHPILFDLTHPFFMYLTSRQGQDYESAINQPEFQANLYAPIASVYEEAFRILESQLGSPYDYIDLGPGYTSYLAIANEYLFRRKAPRFYVPVDVNPYLLLKLCRFTRQLSLITIPFNTLFELLGPQLRALDVANGAVQRLFNLGLTFNNYTPSGGVRLMKQLMKCGDSMLLCSESPDDSSIEYLISPYRNDETEAFNRASIASLGIPSRAASYEVLFRRGRIEMGFRVCRDVVLGSGIRLVRGDVLRTCISCRHSADELLSFLQKHFPRSTVLSRTTHATHSSELYTILVTM